MSGRTHAPARAPLACLPAPHCSHARTAAQAAAPLPPTPPALPPLLPPTNAPRPGLPLMRAATNAPGNHWVYQNMYVDMGLLGPVVDQTMAAAGIPLMPAAERAAARARAEVEDGDGEAWWGGGR